MGALTGVKASRGRPFPDLYPALACHLQVTEGERNMVKIYGVYFSRASRNYWLARELGIEVEEVPVIQAYRLPDPEAKDAPLNTRSPEYLKVTPTGAIPAMDDDGFVLTESLAINLYLARKHGGPLAPCGSKEEALMMQWALYGATAIEPAGRAIFVVHANGRADAADGKAEIEAAAETLRRPLKVLEAHFQVEGYLVGGRFTVADLNLAEILRYAQGHPPLIAEFPAVETWLKSCQARPAFQAMWARRNAETA